MKGWPGLVLILIAHSMERGVGLIFSKASHPNMYTTHKQFSLDCIQHKWGTFVKFKYYVHDCSIRVVTDCSIRVFKRPVNIL